MRRVARFAGMTPEAYLARCDAGESFCSKCNTWKTLDQFHIDRHTKTGHRSECAACCRKLSSGARVARKRRALAISRGIEVRIELPQDPRELYREAKADPARKARFAERQAAIDAAIRRAGQMEEFWWSCRRAAGSRARGPRIAVGKNAPRDR